MSGEAARLRGAAAESHEASAARREAEAQRAAEAAEDVRAVGRMLGYVAAFVTGLPVPDALAAVARSAGVVGRSDALRVLRMAGHNAESHAQAWRDAAPAQRQASNAGPWAGEPSHDPRVTAAVMRGASAAEVAAIRAEVAAEYASAAAARQPSGEMWRTASGEVLADDTRPRVQRQVSQPFPGNAAEFPDRTQVAPPAPEV